MGCSCFDNNIQVDNDKIKIFEKAICNIDGKGNGFICKIPSDNKNNFIPALITTNNIFNNNDILSIKEIKLIINKKEYNISIDNSRRKYTNSEQYNITIIELNANDGIDLDLFLELDNNPKININQ